MLTSAVSTLRDHDDSVYRTDVSHQSGIHDGERTPRSSKMSLKSSPKPRSLSDAPKPTLSPSPAFREPLRRISKDDASIVDTAPSTPLRRSSFHTKGLSLQMPRERAEAPPASPLSRVPVSPILEASNVYGSPASVLPRRSRGLDFARACTNLHHSTLAESSPDASPITSRGIQIPQRRSIGNNTVLDSPSNVSHGLWSTVSGERTTLSSSVSSINMLDSDSDSESSLDDMAIDRDNEDPILNTPAVSKLNSAFAGSNNSPGMEWLYGHPSPAQSNLMHFQPSLMSFRKARMRKGKSHNSSSSVSMHSSKPSPGPLSPPILKSVESSSYFASGMTRQQVMSRRESLSLGTDDLQLSDGEDTDPKSIGEVNGDGQRVIKRAVTRRSNLLPKTKGFARIRAALLEEAAPVETETRREAQVVKQVQESDPTVAVKSPILQPPTTFTHEPLEDSVEEGVLSHEISNETRSSMSGESFGQHAEKNSAGLGFWTGFEGRYRTPPPSLQPQDSLAMSDDVFDTPGSSLWGNGDNPALRHLRRSRSRSITPLAQGSPAAAEIARMVNKKRRREDDFDPAMLKRRAVSPGMSVQSSPVVPQSPVMSTATWGKPPAKSGDRSNSGGSVSGVSVKKVGLQGMTETSEGFMSMSID